MPRTPFLREDEGEVLGAEDCAKIQRDVRQLAGEVAPVQNYCCFSSAVPHHPWCAGSRKTLPLAFLIRVTVRARPCR